MVSNSQEEGSTVNEQLDKLVLHYVKHGYMVEARGENSAQLRKDKKWSKAGCIMTGFLPYWIWYTAFKRDEALYLSVDEHGKVKTVRRKIG